MIQFGNLTGQLSLKAVAWDYDNKQFRSPSYNSFSWSKDGLVSAKCSRCKDEDVPGDECTCGLYSAFRWNIINSGYTNHSHISPVLLVEAIGKTIIYTDGIRSYMQGVIGVINQWSERSLEKHYGNNVRCWGKIASQSMISRAAQSAAQASDYFKVPVLEFDAATIAMDLWNIHVDDPNYDGKYKPESPEVEGMKDEEILELIQTYLPRKEIRWEDLAVKE